MRLRNWFARQWCDLAHLGGRIERDEQGQINWRCNCGRWSDSPVPLGDERKVFESMLKERNNE